MKKTVLFFIITLSAVMSTARLDAQSVPQRETVLIDRFDKVRGVPTAYVEILRDKVIRAFLERGRTKVIDAATMRMLPVVSRENG